MKTQIKLRRKSLITSVAMLLVALVALGGATYAWFSANSQATATGIQMTSTSAEGILVSLDGELYSNNVDFEVANATYSPVSTALQATPEFFETNSEDDTFAKGENSAIAAVVDAKNKYVVDDIYVKPAGDASATKKLQIKVDFSKIGDTSTLASYARVGIVDVTTGSTAKSIGIFSPVAKKYDAYTDTEGTTEEITSIIADTDLTAAGGLTGVRQYKVYVWFEGQDEDCKNVNAKQDMSIDLTFNLVDGV